MEEVLRVVEVIFATIATRKAIMQKTVTNHQKEESHEVKMVDVSYAMKKDTRKLIAQIDETLDLAVIVEAEEEVEAHQ